jgi:D-threo-aldose 1-dehydrogenase
MRQVALTGTNITTTSLGFGCAELFRLPSARRRRKLLATAYDCGIRHFDLAPMYGFGAAEAEVGKFVCTRRSEVVIATKFGISASCAVRLLRGVQGPLRAALAQRPELRARAREPHTAPATGPLGRLLYRAEPFDARTAKASLERSLRALGTDYVDIFLLHEPEVAAVRTDEVRGYLESVRSAGLIRAWGV